MNNQKLRFKIETIEEKNKEAIQRIKSELLSKNPKKIVTIWGAGASVKSGIPGGTYILRKMQNDLRTIKDTDEFKKKLGEEYLEATRAITDKITNRGREFSFEYILSMYSKVYGYEGLHQWLKQYIPTGNGGNPPYFPTFAHEYCSHLANIGMLKYFISVNFDEILESALTEEIGYNNFQVISSKSEFQRLQNKKCDEWEDEYQAKTKCFVLKPHGTISRGLTLRHLPESVGNLENEKRSVLSEVMKDALIIFLGFGNYNEDIWLLFGETYSRGLTDDIVIVGRESGSIKSIKDKLPGDRHTKKIYEFVGNVDEFFKKINEDLSEEFDYKSYRQTPTRHYIRSLFFDLFSRTLVSQEDEEKYRKFHRKLEKIPEYWFDMRIYELELLIYLMKTRGLFIQTTTSESIRIKKAFKKCLYWRLKHDLKEEELRPPQLIDEILNFGNYSNIKKANIKKNHNNPISTDMLKNIENSYISLDELKNFLPDDIFAYSDVFDRLKKETFNRKWCFFLLPPKIESLDSQFTKLCEITAERYCRRISELYLKKNEKIGKDLKEKLGNFQKELAENFKKLYENFDVDITEKDLSAIMRFEAPETINSRKEFVNKTEKLLEKNWDKLRVSTVSAEWIGKEFKKLNLKQKKREIDIVSNLDMFTEKGSYKPSETFSYLNIIRSIISLLDSVKTWEDLVINWYLYRSLEHHMSIFSYNDNNKEEKYTGVIYFNRPGKKTSIFPIYLEKKEDIDFLKKYFEEKLIKNEKYSWITDEKVKGRLFTAKIQKNGEIKLETHKDLSYVTEYFEKWIRKFNSKEFKLDIKFV